MAESREAPKRGDVVMMSFSPQVGHEQAGDRPALVLSPQSYNSLTGLCIVLALTGKAKGYPFEEPVPDGHGVSGVILADQIRTMDWKARRARFRCILPADVVDSAYARFQTLMPDIVVEELDEEGASDG